MRKKPKHRVEIERLIVAGHRSGVCDGEGNSVTLPDGRMIAKPRVIHDVTNASAEDTALEKLRSGWLPL